ncbi:AfsR/SARP family transcriptional regulator [Streptomyces nigra]|uniref:AfsR/SARP family transcriptional regulator n=1 Tax=Streptomyces nigra TaxID=1827580 RepID=UPI00362CF2A0
MLGHDGVHLADDEAYRLPPQTAELLAYLELREGRTARRPAIIRSLWPDKAEPVGRRRLSRLLWRVNQAVSRELVIAEGETVRVSDALTSDWQQAHDALAHPDWPHAPTLKADLELLQLPLLVDVDSPWVEEHQRTWDQRRFYALREAGEILLAGKRLREAVEIAESLVNWEPLDEPSHLLLISAHMKLGAAGRSTELYQEFRRRLRKELGVEPAFELAHVAALAG